MRYLACNTNSFNHTDYNKPITVHKSTDYRTSTGTNHRFIAPFPELFDARVKAKTIKLKNPVFKEDFYVTDNRRNYRVKAGGKNPYALEAPNHCYKVHYQRNVEEKLFQDPPPPLKAVSSEAHEEYYQKPIPNTDRFIRPPNPYQICEMRAYGRDEQPPFRPEEYGYFKYNDIYLTTSRKDYVPYGQKVQDGVSRKDIITFYDATGVPRGGKGYGPKIDVNVEPLVPRRDKPEPIKKNKNKKMPTKSDSVPHFAYKSEYNDMYHPHTDSDFYPYLSTSGVDYKEVLPNATPWQTMAAPGMYCTEYCHVGTGWPIRSVIELKKPEREYLHCISLNCLCNSKVK